MIWHLNGIKLEHITYYPWISQYFLRALIRTNVDVQLITSRQALMTVKPVLVKVSLSRQIYIVFAFTVYKREVLFHTKWKYLLLLLFLKEIFPELFYNGYLLTEFFSKYKKIS